MEYVSAEEYAVIVDLTERIQELTIAARGNITLQAKLAILREQKELIAQRSCLAKLGG